MMLYRRWPHRKKSPRLLTRRIPQDEGPTVTVFIHPLDAGHTALAPERQHQRPVKWWTIGQRQGQCCRSLPRPADGRRRQLQLVAKSTVETPRSEERRVGKEWRTRRAR